jgi:alpha-tubulin suppressor-like RCC1 family protein
MPAIDQSALETKLQTCINGLSTSSAACDIFQAATLISNTSKIPSVATVADLPDLSTSNIDTGQEVWIESLNIPAIAIGKDDACTGWYSLDGRLIISDSYGARRMWTWGINNTGRLGIGLGWNKINYVTCPVHLCGNDWNKISYTSAIKTDGTLWTWGYGNYGAIGNNNTDTKLYPIKIDNNNNWCIINSAHDFKMALKSDGTLWTWGFNNYGQLGNDSIVNKSSPVTIAGGGTNWCDISADTSSAAAIKTDGTLWTWGCGTYGQLGDYTTISKSSPVTIAGGGNNWCRSAGISAIKTDGTLWTWGGGLYGRLGNGTITDKSSPVTTAGGGNNWCLVTGGYNSTTAIKTDGTLWSWGEGAYGILGNGSEQIYSSPSKISGNNWICVTSQSYQDGYTALTVGI